MSDVMVIGIAGGTGSGKTTITKRLMQRFGNDVSVIYHDNYYKAHHDMPYEQRSKLNYDHPNAFDTDMLVDAIKQLKQGHTVTCPVYDYTIHDRTDKTITIKPTKVIVVEGILIFQSRELCQQMDIKIYVDTDADVRILRRITRDVPEPGGGHQPVSQHRKAHARAICGAQQAQRGHHHSRGRSQPGGAGHGDGTGTGTSGKKLKGTSQKWQSCILNMAPWAPPNPPRR